MKKEWYAIKDLSSLINYSRSLIFNSFGKSEQEINNKYNLLTNNLSKEEEEELESVLSYDESLIIIKSKAKQQRNKKTNQTRYLLNDDIYMSILESMNDRMTSNILNNLVNKGLVETAYDEDVDDFIFWIKDENKEDES
jgi:hypothetical protein